jgi:Fe-S cluster assembly iron-binding protein IscA
MALFTKIELDLNPTIVAEAITIFGSTAIEGDNSLVSGNTLRLPLDLDDYPALATTTIEVISGMTASTTRVKNPVLEAEIKCKDSRFYPYWLVSKACDLAIANPASYSLITMRDFCHVSADDYATGYTTRLIRIENPRHNGLLNGNLINGWGFRWLSDR